MLHELSLHLLSSGTVLVKKKITTFVIPTRGISFVVLHGPAKSSTALQ